LVIIALTIREYKRQREARRNPPEAAGAGDGSPTATAGGDTKLQAGSQANATVAGATDPAASRRSQR
jgi:hypothetical protein